MGFIAEFSSLGYKLISNNKRLIKSLGDKIVGNTNIKRKIL